MRGTLPKLYTDWLMREGRPLARMPVTVDTEPDCKLPAQSRQVIGVALDEDGAVALVLELWPEVLERGRRITATIFEPGAADKHLRWMRKSVAWRMRQRPARMAERRRRA